MNERSGDKDENNTPILKFDSDGLRSTVTAVELAQWHVVGEAVSGCCVSRF